MKSFFHVQDIGDLKLALEEARQVKADRFLEALKELV
jgi:hypothetical protein